MQNRDSCQIPLPHPSAKDIDPGWAHAGQPDFLGNSVAAGQQPTALAQNLCCIFRIEAGTDFAPKTFRQHQEFAPAIAAPPGKNLPG